MKTVGEILSKERKKKGFKIAAVAEATKIRPRFIKAIEENNFNKLPLASTAYGFIKNYADFLGLSPKFVLAVFRRDFAEDEKGKIIPRGLVKPLDGPKIFWSPRLGFFLLIALFLLGIFTYLLVQYLSLVRGPSLEITAPSDQITLTSSFVEVVGKTEADATVAINGELINTSPRGDFDLVVDLDEGKNVIVVEATNKLGKTNRVVREVFKKE